MNVEEFKNWEEVYRRSESMRSIESGSKDPQSDSHNQHRFDTRRDYNNHHFVFGEVNSVSYGVYITGIHISGTPERDVSFIQIPGRDGDLTIDNKRWKNIDITYHCAILHDFSDRFDQFKNDLLMQPGYQTLRDTIYHRVSRQAIITQSINPENLRLNRTGTFDVVFNCKPQRYLDNEKYYHAVDTSGGGFHNWGLQPSKPIITVFGTGPGTLTLNDTTIDVLALEDEITIDCETMNAYRQVGDAPVENKNRDIYAPEFPVVNPGYNRIYFTGDITFVRVETRGWML